MVFIHSVEVIMPKEQLDAFRININNVIHGFKENKLDLRVYGASGACNVDVNCPAGNGLELQRDAVAKIYSGSAEQCTGSLINNACEDLRPFFLTANHCLDGMEANWVFRFNYDSPNPVTPACRGSEPTTWITYNGAAVRASNAASDFALLELNQSIIGQPTLALAGWNRNDITPTGGFLIHHPNGDVKKISTIGGTPVISENGGIAGSGDTHIRTSWALGTAEPGSSGAPLFDNNADIIGQIHSGNNIGCTNPSAELTWSGRFFISWTGGGTNTTRLSNWLSNGMNNPPTTINAIRSPTITGTSPVCISNSAFTLNNIIPGRTATWTVTPANLFATSSGAATSGAGTLATLRAASSSVSGLATLTFTISAAAGCNTIPVSIQIWVGVPGQPTANPSGYPTIQMGLGQFKTISLTSAPGATLFLGTWSSTGSITMSNSDPSSYKVFEATSLGTGNFYVNTSNICGTSINAGGTVRVTGSCTTCLTASVSPNPARGFVVLSLSDITNEEIEAINSQSSTKGSVTIFDKLGKPVFNESLKSVNQKLNVSHLNPDLYILDVAAGTKRARTKLMILK